MKERSTVNMQSEGHSQEGIGEIPKDRSTESQDTFYRRWIQVGERKSEKRIQMLPHGGKDSIENKTREIIFSA